MTTWHKNNPIMTTTEPVSLDDLAAALTLNGTADVRRFDMRIDSSGQIFTILAGWAPTAAEVERDGVVLRSDTPFEPRYLGTEKMVEIGRGNVADYCRNAFGAIVRGAVAPAA